MPAGSVEGQSRPAISVGARPLRSRTRDDLKMVPFRCMGCIIEVGFTSVNLIRSPLRTLNGSCSPWTLTEHAALLRRGCVREGLLSGPDRRLGRGKVRRVNIATPRANILSPCLMPKHDLRRKRATTNAIAQLFRKLGFRRLQRRFRKRDLLFQLRLVRRRWQLSPDLIKQAQYRTGSAQVVSPFGCHHIAFPAYRALSVICMASTIRQPEDAMVRPGFACGPALEAGLLVCSSDLVVVARRNRDTPRLPGSPPYPP